VVANTRFHQHQRIVQMPLLVYNMKCMNICGMGWKFMWEVPCVLLHQILKVEYGSVSTGKITFVLDIATIKHIEHHALQRH
jgi:hypothetical protein